MKNLKLMMMTLMMSLLFVSFSQNENKITNNIFNTTLKSGIGEEIKLGFKISFDDIEKIQKTQVYKNWDSTTFNNPKNKDYVEKWKHLTHIETFLMSNTTMASFWVQIKCKNSNSYSPISGEGGFIYVNDKNEIVISFPMKAQNDYGNFIISKGYYRIKWNDDTSKSETEAFIY